MAKALDNFTGGKVSFLLLSAQAKASGANLQCATHVILLDPAGSSAEHGAALEQQAIGRAVRMGQEKRVKVVRFCVKETIEPMLFTEIDQAAARAKTRANDKFYVCEHTDDKLPLRATKAAVDNDNEVVVTKSLTLSELLECKLVEAEQNGLVIDLEASDEEGECFNAKRPAADSPAEGSSGAKRIRAEATKASTVNLHRVSQQTVKVEPTTAAVPVSVTPELRSESSSGSETNSSSGTVKRMGRMKEVRDFLERCHLSEYASKFEENGYDCIDWLYDCVEKPLILETLCNSVGFKPGHDIRFKHLLSMEASELKKTVSNV